MSSRSKYLLIIIFLSSVIYANTLKNEFVSDDVPAIKNNPRISEIFSAREFVGFTYSLNYLIGKLNPVYYHLTNIFLHSLNSILVFFFLCLFFKPYPSFFGALIFAAHPIHTEAVTWIAGRPYVLMALFFLCSFFLYLRATSQDKLRLFIFFASLVVYYLCLCYATIFGFVFPAMVILYDFTFGRWRKNWKLWLIFLIIAATRLFLILGTIKQRIADVAVDIGRSQPGNPLFNMAFSIFTHLRLLIWPQNLTLYHEPVTTSISILILEILLLVTLILCLPLIFKKAKVLFFAICIYILFLTPTYSPKVISWLIAERYLYFPSIALSMFAAFFVQKQSVAVRKLHGRYVEVEKSKKLLNVILIVLVALYSWRTIVRNTDWRTHASIWRATAKVSPYSPRAHNNMGDVYSLEGNPQLAVLEFRRAIELRPDYADAYHNLATTYYNMGRVQEAIENYKKAISFNSKLYQSYVSLGGVYFNMGRLAQAKEYLLKAQELKPDDPSLKQILQDINK